MTVSQAKVILVVDDDRNILLALQKRLEVAGYQVLTATSAEDAVEVAIQYRPDAITLDVSLPGDVDGLALASRLRRVLSGPQVPILFVTGTADERFKQRCSSAGGVYFLSKPYDSELLIQILKGIFAKDDLAEMKALSEMKRRQPA